jgi:hypothetical protein
MAGFGAFANKRLCDVVFPGTHDAGIYGNDLGSVVKTQRLSIGEQAKAGVRYFDLRIIKVKTGHGLEQKAYHAPGFNKKDDKKLGAYQTPKTGGDVGSDRLSQMLDQAREFVMKNPEEFLILRFSKCGDMLDVANQCILKLGAERFASNVNLNVATVASLQGKVVTVFDRGDFDKFPAQLKSTPGILPVKALFNKEGTNHAEYNPNMWGLQYFGNYSNTGDKKKNIKKQMKIMSQGPISSPELLGMMYWTLTSNWKEGLHKLFYSIEKRDKGMWTSSQQALTDAWKAGVKDHIIARAGVLHQQWRANGFPPQAINRVSKSFMPNIIMIDFADPDRCATIWNLNLATADMIGQLRNDLLVTA